MTPSVSHFWISMYNSNTRSILCFLIRSTFKCNTSLKITTATTTATTTTTTTTKSNKEQQRARCFKLPELWLDLQTTPFPPFPSNLRYRKTIPKAQHQRKDFGKIRLKSHLLVWADFFSQENGGGWSREFEQTKESDSVHDNWIIYQHLNSLDSV